MAIAPALLHETYSADASIQQRIGFAPSDHRTDHGENAVCRDRGTSTQA